MSDHFKMTDGAYRIGSNEKQALRSFFLDRIKQENKFTPTGKPSKGSVVTKTFIDGKEQLFRNRAKTGDLSLDAFGFADKGTKQKEIQRRRDSLKLSRPEYRQINVQADKERALYNMFRPEDKHGKEHSKMASRFEEIAPRDVPIQSDDPMNTRQSPVKQMKVKNNVEMMQAKYQNPWESIVSSDGKTRIINWHQFNEYDPEEFDSKGNRAGIEVESQEEVAKLNKAIETGDTKKLKSTEKKKYNYLMKGLVARIKSPKSAQGLFRTLAQTAGNSNNPIANIAGDLVGTVVDGVAFAQNKNMKSAIDLAISAGESISSLGALGLSAVPIPGARVAAFALMKTGDKLSQAARITNLAGTSFQMKPGSKSSLKLRK